MVVSKRCKICAVLDTNNVSILGEYFGKCIPDLITQTCGIEIDSHKASGNLICQLCIIQLVQTDMVIEKIRNAVQRLKKNVKNGKPRNSLKNSSDAGIKNKSAAENGEQQHDETTAHDEKKPKTPKKIERRKSVYPGENSIDTGGNNRNIETPNTVNSSKFKKLMDNDMTPTKSTVAKPSKRKRTQSSNESASNVPFNNANAVDTTLVKRNKTVSVSVSEESPVKLIIDERNGGVSNNEMAVKENKAKVLNCIICGNIFYSKTALRDHFETAHTGEKLKSCPHCSSEFRSQQKYQSHVFSEKCKHANHACQYPNCNKRFKTLHKMEIHMLEKHSSQNELVSD